MERKSDIYNTNQVYDEFEPLSNWKSEQGFETLTIYLPGFKKEQLKVQVTSTRKLRVMGERPAGTNKWIRFRKEFPIKPNIDIDSVAARFEGANLVLKLPTFPEPMIKQTSHISPISNPPLVPTDNLKLPGSEVKEPEKVQPPIQTKEKEEGSKDAEKENVCEGVKKEYRSKVNAYKEDLGGYVTLMKDNCTAMTAGVVAPAAAVLLLSLGFYAGRMFNSN